MEDGLINEFFIEWKPGSPGTDLSGPNRSVPNRPVPNRQDAIIIVLLRGIRTYPPDIIVSGYFHLNLPL